MQRSDPGPPPAVSRLAGVTRPSSGRGPLGPAPVQVPPPPPPGAGPVEPRRAGRAPSASRAWISASVREGARRAPVAGFEAGARDGSAGRRSSPRRPRGLSTISGTARPQLIQPPDERCRRRTGSVERGPAPSDRRPVEPRRTAPPPAGAPLDAGGRRQPGRRRMRRTAGHASLDVVARPEGGERRQVVGSERRQRLLRRRRERIVGRRSGELEDPRATASRR